MTAIVFYSSNENVISIDPVSFTVTALAEGEARIFAESIDGESYTVCSVTVGDLASKDVSVMKSGSDFLGLSQKEQKKITARSLTRYLDFIADSSLDESGYGLLSDRTFDLIGGVKPGTENEQSELARSLGIDSDPLPDLNSVTLVGTVSQILSYVKNNNDLIEIFDLGSAWIIDPIEEDFSSEVVQKTMNLKGNVENLTKVSVAHKLGLTGKGRIIAVIDTGIVSSHEQFKGRVIREACFSTKNDTHGSVCRDGATGAGSANPSSAIKKIAFNHGAHVAGIMAGRDGIAPSAKIVAINGASEQRWTCTSKEERNTYRCSNNSNQCCAAKFTASNQGKSYQYLLDLVNKEGLKIDAVNMSYGGGKYANVCDEVEKWRKSYFTKLIAAGILPIAAAGNESYNDGISAPACISNAYAVAALANKKNPTLASFSNFNKLVDIAAPGTDIYSALAIQVNSSWKPTCTTNCYGYKSGTSMATPMVTGAVAIVKQLYPGKSAMDTGNFLKVLANKSVNTRGSVRMNVKKPVLTFSTILSRFSIPDANVTASGQTITLTFDRIKMPSRYTVKVIDLVSKKEVPFVQKTEHKGTKTTLTLTGNGEFRADRAYRIEISRFIKGQKNPAKVVKYAGPTPVVTSLTAAPRNNGVDINVYMDRTKKNSGVLYRIFDSATRKLVKQINVKNGSQAQSVTGLKNGNKYFVTAALYRTAKIGKNSYTLWGAESEPVYFVPLSVPYGCKLSWPVKEPSFYISCAADPASRGIAVFYRDFSDPEAKIMRACVSDKGQFHCEYKHPSIDRLHGAYQFFIMKMVDDPSKPDWLRFGPSVVINRDHDPEKSKGPEKPLVYLDENEKRATISTAATESDGITVLKQDGYGLVSPFCDSAARACSANDTNPTEQISFLVFRWSRGSDGKKTYSSSLYVNNKWSSN